jgi:hypothetical protein
MLEYGFDAAYIGDRGRRIAGDHDEVAALILTAAVAMLASLALIEPATTRAAGLGRRRQGADETRDP